MTRRAGPREAGDIVAVTLDFHNTLVHHRQGRGRGAMVMAYLAEHGLHGDAWEHAVLYDLFEPHQREYEPTGAAKDKQRYFERLTDRLFRRLHICAPSGAVVEHATHLWNLVGPASLVVFPEVADVLETLRRAGCPLAVVSNWQCGLEHFCRELGMGHVFDHVLASAELGWEKPDPAIFAEACRRLGLPPARVLHVGDTMIDDIDGARGAGMQAVLLRRNGEPVPDGVTAIPSLDHLPGLLDLG